MKLALGPSRTACKTLALLGRTRTVLLTGGALLMVFAACARSDEEGSDPTPAIDGGSPEEATIADAGTDDAEASLHVDAEALRCSGEYCLVDLPNAAVHGLSTWLFAGVHVDPQTGPWAIANGEGSDEGATAQLLHFEGGGWKVKQAVKLAVGADTRGVRLLSISGDGKGNLLAVGTTTSEPRAGVILRGDGTTISVTAFEEELYAAYFASPDTAFIAGAGGRIFRSTSDGDWVDESAAGGNFVTIWGSGPDDLYVGGAIFDEDFGDDFGYLGHRTLDDTGAKTWSFVSFAPPDTPWPGFREIQAGVTSGTRRFFSDSAALAGLTDEGGEVSWTRDAFIPPVPLRSFWARSQDEIYAVGDVGRIYRSDGTTWKDAFLVFNGAPLTKQLTGIAGTSAGELFVVGAGVALRRAPQ